MSQSFPKKCKSFKGNVKIEIDLSSYASNAELKNATGADASKLVAKSDLGSLKAEVDKIDIDKLETAFVDLAD